MLPRYPRSWRLHVVKVEALLAKDADAQAEVQRWQALRQAAQRHQVGVGQYDLGKIDVIGESIAKVRKPYRPHEDVAQPVRFQEEPAHRAQPPRSAAPSTPLSPRATAPP